MDIIFLGTGDAFGSGGRGSVSILARTEDFGLLLDCGPGALPMLKRLGHPPDVVDVVVLSHHHGDHFAGVPFLLLEYQYLTSRRRPLTIAGPPGTEEKITRLSELLFPGLGAKARSYRLSFLGLEDGKTETFGPAEVTPFRVRHFPGALALGFHLHMKGKRIVYSGDTEWTDELARQSEGADLFVCECSTFNDKAEYHMSHGELARRRDQIKAKRVVLFHAGEDVLSRRDELIYELADDGQKVQW